MTKFHQIKTHELTNKLDRKNFFKGEPLKIPTRIFPLEEQCALKKGRMEAMFDLIITEMDL